MIMLRRFSARSRFAALTVQLTAGGLAFCFTAPAQAGGYGLNDWVNPTPSALTPFNGDVAALAGLAGDSVFVYPHPLLSFQLEVNGKMRSYSAQRFASAAVVLPVPAEAVRAAIENYPGYAAFFPQTTLSKMLAREGRHTLMKYHVKIDLPMPLPNVSEDLTAQHTIENDHTVSARLIEAPVPVGLARYEWFPLDDTHTLVTFTSWADLNSARFLLRTIMNAFPDIKLAVPYVGNGFLAETFRRKLNADAGPGANLPSLPPMPLRVFGNDERQRLSRLTVNGPVSFIEPPLWVRTDDRPTDLRFITTIGRLNADPVRTREATVNYARYREIFPQVRKVKLENTANGFNVDLKLGVGLGFLSLPIRTSLAHVWDKDQSLVFNAYAGDVEHIHGRWRWEAQPEGAGTWMTLHSAGKVGAHPPYVLRVAQQLPYNDFLPTMGAQVISLHKFSAWLDQGRDRMTPTVRQKDSD